MIRVSGLPGMGLRPSGAQDGRHRFPTLRVYVFARSPGEQAFARSLGAVWAGDTKAQSQPRLLDYIIDTTRVWTPVVAALAYLKPDGRLVINAIRKEAADHGLFYSPMAREGN